MDTDTLIRDKLTQIVAELSAQGEVGANYDASELGFADTIAAMREYLSVGENAIAYELIVASLERHPFTLSGRCAVLLLEVGLVMRYKTEDPKDSAFDSRRA